MIYELINNYDTPALRRLLAALVLIAFPALLVISIIIGTALSIFDFFKNLVLDLKDLGSDVVTVLTDLFAVLKTGRKLPA